MRRVLTCLLLSIGAAGVALAAGKAAPQAAASSATQKLTFTNKLVDGKKTWLPAEAQLKTGATVEITLVNTLAEPHGFTAPGLVENVVVDALATKVVSGTAAQAGKLSFSCQLHPAHVGGQITVQ